MKLSDTQLVILNTACQRADRRVLPLPSNLKGGAADKVVTSLIAKDLVQETPAELKEPVWRTAEDDQLLTLVVTGLAFEVLGIEPEEAPGADTGGHVAASAKRRKVIASRAKKGTVAPLWHRNEAGGPDRHAAFGGWRHHRGDHEHHRMAVTHGAGRVRRRAEE